MTGKKKQKKASQTPQQQQAQANAKRQEAIGRTRSASQAAPPTGQRAPAQGHPSPAPAVAAPTRFFLDVAAVRIQQWLTRTPELRGYRGASALLTTATARKTWEDGGHLPRGVIWNDGAGDVDGVVQLVVEDPTLTHDEALAILSDAAKQVAGKLRADLPRCPLSGVIGAGASYVDAYAAMEDRRAAGDLVVDYPASPPQVILSKPCDTCRTAPASSELSSVTGDHPAERDKPKQVCADCLARYPAAGGTKGSWALRAPHAEQVLKRALSDRGVKVVDFQDDFTKLALSGAGDTSTVPTHLALIYADGNRVGDFMSAAAKAGADKSEIVPALDLATRGALADAVVKIMSPGKARPPMLPHIVGGDDVAATVPAAHAWAFTIELLGTFSRGLGELSKGWGEVPIPTMSAGLVFFHRSTPFADVVDDAKRLLRDAKDQVCGNSAAVTFLDLTADGSAAPYARQALNIDELVTRTPEFDAIAGLSASHRQVILDLLRRAASPDRKSDEVQADANLAFERIQAQGNDVLISTARGAGSADKNPLAAEIGRARLRTALDIARHWQPTDSRAPTGVDN